MEETWTWGTAEGLIIFSVLFIYAVTATIFVVAILVSEVFKYAKAHRGHGEEVGGQEGQGKGTETGDEGVGGFHRRLCVSNHEKD